MLPLSKEASANNSSYILKQKIAATNLLKRAFASLFALLCSMWDEGRTFWIFFSINSSAVDFAWGNWCNSLKVYKWNSAATLTRAFQHWPEKNLSRLIWFCWMPEMQRRCLWGTFYLSCFCRCTMCWCWVLTAVCAAPNLCSSPFAKCHPPSLTFFLSRGY